MSPFYHLLHSYTPLIPQSYSPSLCLYSDSKGKRLAQLLILDLRITLSHTGAAQVQNPYLLLSWLPRIHLAFALRIRKPFIHLTALPSQQKRSPPTIAPMESLIMTSLCYQLRISSSWAFSQSLLQLCVFSEYTNQAVSSLTRSSKMPLRPYTPCCEAGRLIAISVLAALLQSTSKEDSSWTFIHHWRNYS